MAKTKSQGAVKGNRDSIAKRLGVKMYGGEKVTPGDIIVRQRGTIFHSGFGTSVGRDFTIFSIASGIVKFKMKHGKKYVEVI